MRRCNEGFVGPKNRCRCKPCTWSSGAGMIYSSWIALERAVWPGSTPAVARIQTIGTR